MIETLDNINKTKQNVTNNLNNIISTHGFGKFILSGEHSVVYGCPALALATKLTCNVQLSVEDIHFKQTEKYITIKLLNYNNWQKTFSLSEVCDFQTYIQQYANNKLPQQHDLAIYAISVFINYYKYNKNFDIKHNLTFIINSQVPINCGMGSSASLIVSLGKAIGEYMYNYALQRNTLNSYVNDEEFLALCLNIENIQHGRSSGIDLYIAYYGHGVFFKNNCKELRDNLIYNQKIRLVNTGSAYSTTREAVSYVAEKMQNKNLLLEFSSVTTRLDHAWSINDQLSIAECLDNNHELLCRIEVVPTKVQNFIDALKQRNMSGKISGAGTIHGDAAGIVIVYGEGTIEDLLNIYGYKKIHNQS